MPDSTHPSHDPVAIVRIHNKITDIAAADWDICCDDANIEQRPANPFIRHAFLAALEQSGSITPETGWMPYILAAYDQHDRLTACAPLYLKGHSQGEYVFDHGWANAYQRAGGRYYPKAQICVPFTPVTGKRLLYHPLCHNPHELELTLWNAACSLTDRLGLSSLHVTFLPQASWQNLGDRQESRALKRTHHQFHWHNHGYRDYDDFLAIFPSRKRKTFKRERREALDGLSVTAISGGDLTEAHWDLFYDFYCNTINRKWGEAYLTRDFFSLIGATMADSVLLMLCHDGDNTVAATLSFIGQDTLFGRYWGCRIDRRFLHFELCYYQAIDYALAHGLNRVEAGAQGVHKFLRGYEPASTYSLHYLADRYLEQAVRDYLVDERDDAKASIEIMKDHAPYKRSP